MPLLNYTTKVDVFTERRCDDYPLLRKCSEVFQYKAEPTGYALAVPSGAAEGGNKP